MVRIAYIAIILPLLFALTVAAYPATEGELLGIIQNCEDSVCNVDIADCERACASDKDACFSACRGAMSACFNDCEIIQQSCLNECATWRAGCISGCLTHAGLGACVPTYDTANKDPFIICVMSHEPGPTPAATPSPAASATPSPQAAATPTPYFAPSCAEGMFWNGTDCVLFEIPPSAPCLFGFALTALLASTLFVRRSRH